MRRSAIAVFIVLLFAGSYIVTARDLNVHTSDGEVASFNLDNVDSLTFSGRTAVFALTDEIDITMVWIPAGSFMMGRQEDEQDSGDDEDPRHEVNIDYGFWMGKYEVTQAQWEAVTGNNPAHTYGVGDDYPVYYVSWNDIHEEFLSQIDNSFRLPSESEREYACRAGTDTRFYWGDDPDYDEIGDYAVYGENNENEAVEVGTKLPNAFGLYDMNGNVWEWCEDWYHDSYEDAPDDGSAWDDDGTTRTLRGGAWYYRSDLCRSADRDFAAPGNIYNGGGFRLVRDAD